VRVGFIGLGSQGGGMARRLVACGVPTTLWARRPEVLVDFPGAAAAASPADLAARCDLVSVCVVDDAGVDDVLGRPDGVLAGMAPGGVVAVHATVHPATCERWAAAAAERDVTVLDAPVSGGGAVAEGGRLLVMVGGPTEVVERCRPVFETYGDPVVHTGPVGTGQLAKLVNNVLFTAHLALAHDAARLASGLGLDPQRLGEILQHGSGASYAGGVHTRMGSSLAPLRDGAGPLLRKDIGLLADLAAARGLDVGALVEVAERATASMAGPET
jgi:3-hydroxyisobutyrate dehydrogenase-like beta-hydroxyacid dehydrogenase